MKHLPAFLDLIGRRCLVVGGGAAAWRKASLLLRTGANVAVVANAISENLAVAARAGRLVHLSDDFCAEFLDGIALVVAATGKDVDDRAVARAARQRNIPVNVVDRPELSTFIIPAVVDRDPVLVAVSSGGEAPVLARNLRAAIERLLPARIGRLARFAGRFRSAVKARISDPAARRRFWERFFEGPVAEAVLSGEEAFARTAMIGLINSRDVAERNAGTVFLVGAGPGEPDLLTLRALGLMQRADVIVHDRLVTPAILDRARRDALFIDVGKTKGEKSASQAAIDALMVDHARAGRCVVRLKSGDPFIFGRGGEELAYLEAAGVHTKVVPGITAAVGCAARAGIPLTHRDHAHAVTFVTGQRRAGAPDPDWSALARSGHTLVIYMGVSEAGEIARQLVAHGLRPTTRVAVIENGTRPEQKVVEGTVARLGSVVAENRIAGPAVIIVGEVVGAVAEGLAGRAARSPVAALA